MKRVRVDFNARDERGLVPVPLARLGTETKINDTVEVYDGEEEFFGPVSVVHIDADRGIAYLDVSWDQLREPDPMPRIEAEGDFVAYNSHEGYLVIQVKSYSTSSVLGSIRITTMKEKTRTHIASDVPQKDLLAS